MAQKVWSYRLKQGVYTLIFLGISALILFLLIPSLLLTHSRASEKSVLTYSCDPALGNIGQRMWCETTRWYLGLFVDNLEVYDIRQLNDAIGGAATQTNAFAKDVDTQIEEYIQENNKREVEYVFDEEEGVYTSQ